tara:strand:- start:398 stop:814 length:417 start_codon:yes stop_codon:yes gene_type:complete
MPFSTHHSIITGTQNRYRQPTKSTKNRYIKKDTNETRKKLKRLRKLLYDNTNIEYIRSQELTDIIIDKLTYQFLVQHITGLVNKLNTKKNNLGSNELKKVFKKSQIPKFTYIPNKKNELLNNLEKLYKILTKINYKYD